MRQIGDAANVNDVGVAEADVRVVVERGEALAQLHRSVILPNYEDDDEKAHRSENTAEQVLGRDESPTVFRGPVETVSRVSGAVAVSLIGIVVGAVDFPVAPVHEISLAMSISALEAAAHPKPGITYSLAKTTPLVRLIGALIIKSWREKRFPADVIFRGEAEARFAGASKDVVD